MKNNTFFRALMNKRMLVVFLMGFSSGLPLLLIGGTLKAWFTESQIDLTTIGFFSLVGLPYTTKFLWAPLTDKYIPPFMGRRRGWLIVSQIFLALCIGTIGLIDPKNSISIVAIVALAVAFFSATQDIVVDAYRREVLDQDELGLGNSYAITGYRIAMLVAGALALALADFISWKTVYLSMSAMMLVGIGTTIYAMEPDDVHETPKTWTEAFVGPFVDFFSRQGAIWILAFILLYKVGDAMASEMTMPFYIMLGFSKTEIAGVVKIAGIWATLGGAFVGGVLMLRLGLQRSLWIFGILQAISTLGFAILAQTGPDLKTLSLVIGFENLTAGMGTSAYAAFMANLTNKRFTATQYALLSSLMGVPRVIIGAPSGYLAKHLGWESYFVFCAAIAIPGLLLLFKIGKWAHIETNANSSATPPQASNQIA